MSKPRTVTRFVEETVTLGQIAHEAYRARRNDIGSPWADLSDAQRAGWEHAAAAVAEAIEGELDDTLAPQPEPHSATTEEQRAAIRNGLAAAPKTDWHVPVTADDLRQAADGATVTLASVKAGSTVRLDRGGITITYPATTD